MKREPLVSVDPTSTGFVIQVGNEWQPVKFIPKDASRWTGRTTDQIDVGTKKGIKELVEALNHEIDCYVARQVADRVAQAVAQQVPYRHEVALTLHVTGASVWVQREDD